MRLLEAAKNKPQLQLVMQTICGTGIRVSELKFFTVEDVKQGEVLVNCKGKTRTVLIPGKLRKLLLDYAKKEKIRSGVIFLTRNGKPLNRSCIWTQMKALCEEAGVNPSKVFPHNLHMFAALSMGSTITPSALFFEPYCTPSSNKFAASRSGKSTFLTHIAFNPIYLLCGAVSALACFCRGE